MGDVKKDVEAMRRINATPKDKLEIMCDITDFVVGSFIEKIKKENPKVKRNEIIQLLRKRLYHGRRDTY